MTELAELARKCLELNIRLTPIDGDQLKIDAPRGVVTPELLARLTAHKAEILVQLRSNQVCSAELANEPGVVWQEALNLIEDDPLFTPQMMQALRAADVNWEKTSNTFG